MLWRSAEGYVKHWFALLGAMLVVALRFPLSSLLRDSWLYSAVSVTSYEFTLESSLVTTMTLLVAMYAFLKWFDQRAKLK